MREPLNVEVQGDSIIVTMPGTALAVTYQKHIDGLQLVMTEERLNASVSSTVIFRFQARAFHYRQGAGVGLDRLARTLPRA